MKIEKVVEAYRYCHRCGGEYTSLIPGEEWPKLCPNDPGPGCGNIEYAQPKPIGVMLQVVTDGERMGILTPVRGHQPQAGRPAITGGYAEMRDRGLEDSGSRETCEEVGLSRVPQHLVMPLVTRATGPFIHGRRQILFFGVNHEPVHVSEYDKFVPDKETAAIDFTWRPRVLAFPSHTFAVCLYLKLFQGMDVPDHFLHQPVTGDLLEGEEIFDIPYDQPDVEQGIWNVLMADGGIPVGVVPEGERWRRVK